MAHESFEDPETAEMAFATGHDAEQLIPGPRSLFDNPTPSDNSLAAEALAALAAATGDPSALDRIEAIARLAGVLVERAPSATDHLLAVLASVRDQQELAIVGDAGDPRTAKLQAVARERFRPEVFVAVGRPGDPDPAIPLLRDRPPGPDGTPRAYLCRGFVCSAPVDDPEALRSLFA